MLIKRKVAFDTNDNKMGFNFLTSMLTESPVIHKQNLLGEDNRLVIEPPDWTPFILTADLVQNEVTSLLPPISAEEKTVLFNLLPGELNVKDRLVTNEFIPLLKNDVTLPFAHEENLQEEGILMFRNGEVDIHIDFPMSSMVQDVEMKKGLMDEFILSLRGSESPPLPAQSSSPEQEGFHDLLPEEFKWMKNLITENNGIPPNHRNGNRIAMGSSSPLLDLSSNPLKSLSSEKIQEEHANFQLKIDHLQILQEIGQKIVWSFKNNEGRIRFLVEPPELGNIYMEIKKDKGNIQVTLWAENTITKEMLETNQIQLYRMLKGDGFTLDKFDVFVQQDMKDFQDWEKNFVHYDRKSSDGLEERQTAPGEYLEADSHPLLNLFHRGNQYVDLFV